MPMSSTLAISLSASSMAFASTHPAGFPASTGIDAVVFSICVLMTESDGPLGHADFNARVAPSGSARVMPMAEAFDKLPLVLEEYLGNVASFDAHTFTALNTAFINDGAVVCAARRRLSGWRPADSSGRKVSQ